jgi:hypothetical protein
MPLRFYIGLHQPSDAQRFERCCIHLQRLVSRRKPLGCAELLLDSRAFNELRQYGRYRSSAAQFADQVHRIAYAALVDRLVPVTQDYMCEAVILRKTGRTVAAHQRLTIERYDAIRAALDASLPLMPVLQGALPEHYIDHLRQYAERLTFGMWVGVGSVCKRNGHPREIAAVLRAIRAERPDLRLHGFGCKLTALGSAEVRAALHSADSLAWSYAARKQGRNPNDWREAQRFLDQITAQEQPAPRPLERLAA